MNKISIAQRVSDSTRYLENEIGGADFWPGACDVISDVVSATGAVLLPLDPSIRDTNIITSPRMEELSQVYLKDGWFKRDLRQASIPLLLTRGYAQDGEFIDPSVVRRAPYFQELLAPFEVGNALILLLSISGRRWALSIQRDGRKGEFTKEQIQGLMQLKKPIEHAAAITAQNTALSISSHFSAFHAPDEFMVCLSRDNSVIKTEGHAELLKRWSAQIVADRLVFDSTDISRRWRAFLERTKPNMRFIWELQRAPACIARSEHVRLFAKSSKLYRGDYGLILADRIISFKETTSDKSFHGLIANTLKVSERQGEIAYLIAGGLSTLEIAKILGISAQTVRHHVKYISARTGLRSMVRIAVAVNEIVPVDAPDTN